MVLYTVVAPETLFDSEQSDELNPFEEIEHEGARVLVWRSGPGAGRIERLISTDAAHYLRPDLQPGVPAPKH